MTIRVTENGVVLETKAYSSNSKTMMLNIVIDEVVRLKTKRWTTSCRSALHIVIMNMIACVRKNQRLYYSRAHSATLPTTYNRRKVGSKQIIKVVDQLEEDGYLFNYVADRQYGDIDDKQSSYVIATAKFVEKFCNSEEVVDGAEFEHIAANINIELRDKKKKRIDFDLDGDLVEAERVVNAVNVLNSKHTFIDHAGELMVNLYGRIFNNGSFLYGGRWFKAAILKIKNKKTKNRLRTWVDNESVVEVDFDCLHINMLCDMMGVDKYRGIDIYYHVLEKQHYNTDNRRLIKLGINIMLNATSRYKAGQAIQDMINEESKGTYCYNSGTDVMQAIDKALPEFKDKFCNNQCTGLVLQNKDSWIAHYVLDEFVKIQEPILVVHDSFIVQRRNADKLVNAMSYAYQYVIKVERVVSMKMNWLEDNNLCVVDCSK